MNTTEHARAVLAASITQSIQRGLQAHRAYVETLAEQSIRDGAAVGFVEIDGVGESVVEIAFPLKFLEKPAFTAGLELGENVWLHWGSFPNWSATVGAWTTEPSLGDPVYTGATVGIVVTGAQKSVLHYRFEAQSITHPTGSDPSMGATL